MALVCGASLEVSVRQNFRFLTREDAYLILLASLRSAAWLMTSTPLCSLVRTEGVLSWTSTMQLVVKKESSKGASIPKVLVPAMKR